jgi:hypothetical protein
MQAKVRKMEISGDNEEGALVQGGAWMTTEVGGCIGDSNREEGKGGGKQCQSSLKNP